jgi:3-oxoacyl-[acyl-carrier-protein] synthase I
MRDVFIVSDNILSPLGVTAGENFSNLTKSVSGVKKQEKKEMSALPFYASLFDSFPAIPGNYTQFEQLLIMSLTDALKNSDLDTRDKKTILIISSTKGNISLLETEPYDPGLKERIALHTSARLVASHFEFVHSPIIVSNACISGIAAILTGMRMIRSGQYDHAIIAGADVISRFVLSGFQSFQAISPGPCKPFDRDRNGINLGEGAATLILSSDRKYAGGKNGGGEYAGGKYVGGSHAGGVTVSGGAISNDANHLSAPSRTGEELCMAMTKAMLEAGLSTTDIDFISAHGTATQYNDEMEAKAITLAGMQSVPVNGLKGYYGHTLGACGLIESVVSIHSLKENLILPTRGFEQMGVTKPLNISRDLLSVPLKNCLKLASGFGGCNAALVFSKNSI